MKDGIRWGEKKDAERIRQLWDICFGDPKSWCDWFFANRSTPERTLCLEREGQIVADMQIYPYPLRLRNAVFNAVNLHGVATHPNWRRKGLMGELMSELMPYCRDNGIPVMFHTPVRFDQYFAYDHIVTAKRNVFMFDPIDDEKSSARVCDPDIDFMLAQYTKFAGGFSGMVERGEKEMKLRVADACSDGGKIMCVNDGYAIFYVGEDKAGAIETVYNTPEALADLVAALRGFGVPLEVTLPQNAVPPCGAELSQNTYNVLRITDVSAILEMMKLRFDVKLGVVDRQMEANSGTYDCLGKKTDKNPDIVISAGQFGQLISGYKSIFELCEEGAEENVSGSANALDKVMPKLDCYVFEPY